MKKLIVLLVLLAGAGAAAYSYFGVGKPPDLGEVTRAAVSSGRIVQSVRAVGTLQPTRQVRIGSQVSGTVKSLLVDYNSVVKAGQVIAEVDPAPFEMQVAVQKANIARQETDIERQKVQLANAQTNHSRAQQSYDKGLVSLQALEAAAMQVKALASQIAAAQKMLVQAQAQLTQAELNVSYCTIKSPIDGVVTARFTDVGNALQASVNTPTLFLIAHDLSKLRLQAGVDEADIGRLRPGLPVTFSVDAYRGEPFRGQVEAVRIGAQVQESVVTYPVWIEVDNADLRLRPGMTATLQIIVDEAPEVVRVPNDALKFRPTSEIYTWLQLPPPPVGRPAVRLTAESIADPPVQRVAADKDADEKIDEMFQLAPRRVLTRVVWVYDEKNPDPAQRLRQVTVKTGLTDGAYTQMVSGDLKPGEEVVTGVTPPASYFAQRTSLFGGPQRRGSSMQKGGEVELPTLQRGGPGGGRGGH